MVQAMVMVEVGDRSRSSLEKTVISCFKSHLQMDCLSERNITSVSWDSSTNIQKHVRWWTQYLSSYWVKGIPDTPPWKRVLVGEEAEQGEGTPQTLSGGSVRALGCCLPAGKGAPAQAEDPPRIPHREGRATFPWVETPYRCSSSQEPALGEMSSRWDWEAPLGAVPGGGHLGKGSSWAAGSAAFLNPQSSVAGTVFMLVPS